MKKIQPLFLAFILFFAISACVKGSAKPKSNYADNEILIAYFSWSGNTEKVANMIHKQVGGKLFEIVPITAYPTNYDKCLEQARQELVNNYRPLLDTHVENMDSYKVIFIGYPIWCGNTPMLIRTFLEEYDFGNKIIIPFCTYGGSGIGESLMTIKTTCPDSTILDAFGVTNSDVGNAQNNIQEWINKLGNKVPLTLKSLQ